MSTKESEAVRKFMKEHGMTGDPKVDGENATDDLNAFRQMESDSQSGDEKNLVDKSRERISQN